MMLIDPEARFPWTPPSDRDLPEAERAVLFFRPMTGRRFLELVEAAKIRGDGELRWFGRDAARIVTACLVDWNEKVGVPFPGADVAVEMLDVLTLQAAAGFVLTSTGLGEVVRKNSGSAPGSCPAPSSTPAGETAHAPGS